MTNPPSQQVPPESGSAKDGYSLWSTIASAKPYIWAVTVAGFYLSGFLVLNAHLAKYGLTDFDFIRGRYLLAAANFAIFVICFYLFAGRAIVLGQNWLVKDLQYINRQGSNRFWSLAVVIHSYVRLVFFVCLSSATYTSLALWQVETTLFYAMLSAAFLFSYTIDITNLDVRFYKINEIVQIGVKLSAILVFFFTPNSPNMKSVFLLYFVIVVYVNFVIDGFQRRKIDADRIIFSSIHCVVALLTIALMFGATFFGSVSSKLGGGRMQEVSLKLMDNVKGTLPSYVQMADDGLIKGQLIYQTEKYLYMIISGQTIRFRDDDVAIVSFKGEKRSHSQDVLNNLVGGTPHKEEDKGVSQ